jgi:ABC-2 type transport system ATP-binding protein
MNIIEAFDLSKAYSKQVAVDQVNLSVPGGSIFGITGPINAGKTTLLRMLATLTIPTAGDAQISGFSLFGNPTRIRRMVGYMPQIFGVYQNMTVAEYLRFFADCYGIPENEQGTLVDDLLQLVDLIHRKNQRITYLTRGMRQRLSLARALINDPQLLLLDEPFTQVDPRAHIEMRELIKELHNMGKTVMIIAATPADVAGLCTDQAIMDHGKIVLSGSADTVKTRIYSHRIIVVKFFGSVEVASRIITRSSGVHHIDLVSIDSDLQTTNAESQQELPAIVTVLKEIHVTFTGNYEDASELLRMLMRSGVQVVSFSEAPDEAGTLIIHPPTCETLT